MRFAKLLLTTISLSFLMLTGLAPAGASEKGPTPKDLFKQNCRVCHEKNSPHGEYSPMTLIQLQWKKFFTTKFVPTHQDVVLPGQDKKLLDALTPEQLKTIQKYCNDGAADSEKPQSCS